MIQDQVICHYDSRSAGSGKTHDQLCRIAESAGLYIYACDRREAIDERIEALNSILAGRGGSPQVLRIHAPVDAADLDGSSQVRVEIEALATTWTSGHVVVFITHAGLLASHVSEFSSWSLIVDEVPSILDRGSLSTAISADLISSLFELEPAGEFSRLLPAQSHAPAAISRDSMTSAVATLWHRASSGSYDVLTQLTTFEEAALSRWTWWSLWDPSSLAHFRAVTVLATDFERSLTMALCRAKAPQIVWRRMEGKADREVAPRRIIIRYFAHSHGATRTLFASPTGQGYLRRIGAYFARKGRGPRIWTCNSADRSILAPLMGPSYLPPRQAGSNKYTHINEATVLYTAKPDLHERRLLSTWGIDPNLITQTREIDTIYQFLARTSQRDPNSSHAVTCYVYDRTQAEAMAERFARVAEFSVTTELIDLGFALTEHRQVHNQLSAAEKLDRKREKARLRQQKCRGVRRNSEIVEGVKD